MKPLLSMQSTFSCEAQDGALPWLPLRHLLYVL